MKRSWQAHVYYDILADAGLIDLTGQEKKVFWVAKKMLKQEAHREVKKEFTRKRIIDEINQHTAKLP